MLFFGSGLSLIVQTQGLDPESPPRAHCNAVHAAVALGAHGKRFGTAFLANLFCPLEKGIQQSFREIAS
jgi:hypothetical protein